MFKHTASRSCKFKIYARFAVAGEREAKPGLKNGREILSRDAAKFNARRKISLCRMKFYASGTSLKFRRKFKIYPAQNLAAARFLEF
ncbi:hypothetical protein [uncultured Campylobacter sp.]|uniref:hypothetical protein n=1 Tax=uncultured Campylobacter sp. TaxID=218934 RepID=UPI002625CE8A|nr:hypothetical protein [uncultured Campylobacter sp.]